MNQLKPVKLILKEFSNDRVSQLSAAFSYSALFSLAPLLLVLISVAGIIYGNQAASGKLFSEMSGSVGPATAKSIQTLVSHIHNSKSGALAILVGTIGSLLGAAGLTSLLQNSFNIILRVVPDPKSGIKRTIYVKLKNISLVILAGLFVAISLVLSALITGFSHKLSHHLGLPSIILELTNDIVSLVIFTLLLYLMYLTIPDVKIPKRIILVSSAIIAVFFVVGKIILSLVIGRKATSSAYGAAASIISLLLWLYYSSQILYLGTEGIKVYCDEKSISLEPKKMNLKRTSVNIDAPGLPGRLSESFKRGFSKGMRK